MANRTTRPERPQKPHAKFPLFPHAAGSWCAKIGGKRYSFGGWATDPTGDLALAKYIWQKPYLEQGTPQADIPEPQTPEQQEQARKEQEQSQKSGPGLTVKWMCNRFLAATEQRMKLKGKPGPRAFNDYKSACERLRDILGAHTVVAELQPADFDNLAVELGKGKPDADGNQKDLAPTTRGNLIIRTRRVFHWAARNRVIDRMPHFGELYCRTSTEEADDHREAMERKNGGRMFERDVLRMLLDAADGKEVTLAEADKETGQPVKVKLEADPVLKALILLAANVGFGNKDCSDLRTDILDLDGGWLKLHRRGKSKKPRRGKLWPETVAAIREAMAVRPQPAAREDADRVFLTPEGLPLVRLGPSGKSNIDRVSSMFDGLLAELRIKRPGLSFYSIRHSYYTTATGSHDTEAVKISMGHAIPGMGAKYLEATARQWTDRLSKVADHVHDWLFGESK